jgi:hypothetical protein
MRRLSAALILSLYLATRLPAAAPAEAQMLGVEGYVSDDVSRPIPGLTVYLLHPTAGRSYPRITDASGRFVFQGVPDVSGPYYLEIYWGKLSEANLVYRQPVTIREYVRLETIVLE